MAAFIEEKEDEEYRLQGSALALYSLGREAEFESKLAELQEKWGARWPADIAAVYAWAGDADAAFIWLEKEVEVSGSLSAYAFDPLLLSLHNDPRWQQLLEKAGSSEKQLAEIKFELTLPE